GLGRVHELYARLLQKRVFRRFLPTNERPSLVDRTMFVRGLRELLSRRKLQFRTSGDDPIVPAFLEVINAAIAVVRVNGLFPSVLICVRQELEVSFAASF